jgi:hypothetical protein
LVPSSRLAVAAVFPLTDLQCVCARAAPPLGTAADWWRINAKPGTYAVAPCFQHVLSIPASAADTERVNSCVNRVQMLHSANMKTETALKLSYCNFNTRSLRQRASRRQLLQPGHYALGRGSEPKDRRTRQKLSALEARELLGEERGPEGDELSQEAQEFLTALNRLQEQEAEGEAA